MRWMGGYVRRRIVMTVNIEIAGRKGFGSGVVVSCATAGPSRRIEHDIGGSGHKNQLGHSWSLHNRSCRKSWSRISRTGLAVFVAR